MNRLLPWIVVMLTALWVAMAWRVPTAPQNDFDTREFGRLPVLVGGRVKPLDTVARNALLIMRSKQVLRLDGGKEMSATRWLADVLFDAAAADQYPCFVIHNQEVLGMFGWPQADKRYCSFAELKPNLQKIDEEGKAAADIEVAERTPFQTAVYNLRNSLVLYQRLKNSVQPEGSSHFAAEAEAYTKAVAAAAAVVKRGQPDPDKERAALMASAATRYETMAGMSYLLAVPPPSGTQDVLAAKWLSTGNALLRATSPESLPPAVGVYAALGDAWRAGDHATFARVAAEYSAGLAKEHPRAAGRAHYEEFFNHAEPFYHCMILYVAAFLLACASWLNLNKSLGRVAFWLLVVALAVHTFGMGSRMWLQERPPVTNLYSSAIFVGWAAVLVGLVLERIFRDGIGAACAGLIGFITLIIAHHLGGSGDTLEMLQAVLDTNIWLATHVVVVTAGYSAMFLAGFLAVLYVVRGMFTTSLTPRAAESLARMVYGVVCFATLFSFTGTVLGGIWADQSWGRFWGWDPKENGALLIVLWCAVTLHARWGGFIRQRGLMAMAIFGNVITAFSWFGVNMLGVGLHSYGFMDKAFPWLVGFMISQVALVVVCQLPLARWRSFRSQAAVTSH